MHLPTTVLVVLVTVLPTATAALTGVAGCTQVCYDNLVAKADTLNCPGGLDTCLCGVKAFQDGLQDCVASLCTNTEPTVSVSSEIGKVMTYCTGVIESARSSRSAAASTMSPTVTSGSNPASNSEAIAGATTPAKESTASTNTNVASTGAITGTPTSHGVDTTAASIAASPSDEPYPGLSPAAKIGIGAGIGGVALFVLILAALFYCRRYRKTPRDTGFSISEPVPGSGRYAAAQTPSPHQPRSQLSSAGRGGGGASGEKTGSSELETRSRRYEDMLPRQKPLQIV